MAPRGVEFFHVISRPCSAMEKVVVCRQMVVSWHILSRWFFVMTDSKDRPFLGNRQKNGMQPHGLLLLFCLKSLFKMSEPHKNMAWYVSLHLVPLSIFTTRRFILHSGFFLMRYAACNAGLEFA